MPQERLCEGHEHHRPGRAPPVLLWRSDLEFDQCVVRGMEATVQGQTGQGERLSLGRQGGEGQPLQEVCRLVPRDVRRPRRRRGCDNMKLHPHGECEHKHTLVPEEREQLVEGRSVGGLRPRAFADGLLDASSRRELAAEPRRVHEPRALRRHQGPASAAARRGPEQSRGASRGGCNSSKKLLTTRNF